MLRLDLTDEQTLIALDPERLLAVARDVLGHEGVVAAEVNVALVDGTVMRRLNARHLGHDYDTDVLSFLLDASGGEAEPSGAPRGRGKTLDGEVVISSTVAAAAAAEFDWSGESEVLLYLVHGLLHLAGYDDLTDGERSLMRRREREHLARWGLTPRYAAEAEPGGNSEPDGEPGPSSAPPFPTSPPLGVRG